MGSRGVSRGETVSPKSRSCDSCFQWPDSVRVCAAGTGFDFREHNQSKRTETQFGENRPQRSLNLAPKPARCEKPEASPSAPAHACSDALDASPPPQGPGIRVHARASAGHGGLRAEEADKI